MKYKTPAALEMAVKEAAKKSPLDTNRAIEGFYFHRLLCRVFSDPESSFVLKGGQSILARTIDARTTRDIDLLAHEASIETAASELKRLAEVDLGDFVSFSFDRAEPIKSNDEYRNGMKIWFTPSLGGKSMQAMSVDLVIDEVDDLQPERITPIDRIPIKDIPTFDYLVYCIEGALADKLLAIIEIHDGRPSSRVKDLIDIVIYAKTCEFNSLLLSKCVSKESRVRKITLPTSFCVPSNWTPSYEKNYKKMAAQARIDNVAPDMASAENLAARIYAPALDESFTSGASIWNPEKLEWEPI